MPAAPAPAPPTPTCVPPAPVPVAPVEELPVPPADVPLEPPGVPCTTPALTPWANAPDFVRSRSVSAMERLYRWSTMSRLFSSAIATASLMDRYILPSRNSWSVRAELLRFGGGTLPDLSVSYTHL